MIIRLSSSSPHETLAVGRRIGGLLTGGEIILLRGDLGAGKTILAKGIAQGLDIDPGTPVTSPSFTLVNLYHARLDIVHADLYRLDSDEITQLGLEDYLDRDHVLVVEWADRARGYFQGFIVEITVTHSGEWGREIVIATDLEHMAPLVSLNDAAHGR